MSAHAVPPQSHRVTFRVNGADARLDLRPNALLANALRDELRLTSVKLACETSQCGACTVLVDGLATKSCTVLAVACDGADVMTIEGLANRGPLHPLQQAFIDHHALQCGFCTPGMIMLALDLLSQDSSPSDAAIRRALTGNICRCTGYEPIVRAISAASAARLQSSE